MNEALSPTLKRALAGPALAASILAGSLAYTSPALANAENYVEQICVVKAMTSKGPNGDGCLSYGVRKWVSTSERGDLPEWAKEDLRACLAAGAVGVATAWVGGAATYTGAAVIMAVACVAPTAARLLVK